MDNELNEAKKRFLSALEAYDSRYEAEGKDIVLKFLNQLAAREAAQSDLLFDLTNETKTEILKFGRTRGEFTSSLDSIFQMYGMVGTAAELLVFRGALLPPTSEAVSPADPNRPPSPIEHLRTQQRNWEARLETLQQAGAQALVAVSEAGKITLDVTDAATGLIVLRGATLAAFRRENVLSPFDKVREHLEEELENELEELYSDEVKERLMQVLTEYGGEVGGIVVDELPAISTIYRLVRAYLRATTAPQKYHVVGGGDLMISLLDALRKQRVVLKGFKVTLDTAYDKLFAVHATLT